MSELSLDEFFGLKHEERRKCLGCKMNTKSRKTMCDGRIPDPWLYKNKEQAEVLVIFESPPLKQIILDQIKRLFTKAGIEIDIISAMECVIKSPQSLFSPMYVPYERCETIPDSLYLNYKAVVILGRGAYAVTKSDDLQHWQDFTELQFNQSYFYKIIDKTAIRCFPIAPPDELFKYEGTFKDSFAVWHAERQIEKVIRFIKTSKGETAEEWTWDKPKDPNEILRRTMNDLKVSWDLEVSSKEQMIHLQFAHPSTRIICMTLTVDGKHSYYLPWELIDKKLLIEWINVPGKFHIMANGKYDSEILEIVGKVPDFQASCDVTIAYKVLNTDRKSNSIKALAWLVKLGGYDRGLDEFRKKHKINDYGDIPEHTLAPYACCDTIVAWRVHELAEKLKLLQPQAYALYENEMMNAIPTFRDMKLAGIEINLEKMKSINEELLMKSNNAKIRLREVLNNPNLNPDSGGELTEALEAANIPCLGITTQEKKRSQWSKKKDSNSDIVHIWSTGDDELRKWKRDGFEFAKILEEYRGFSKQQSTFLGDPDRPALEKSILETPSFFQDRDIVLEDDSGSDGMVVFIRNGRFHSEIAVGRAHSARTTSTGPNTQNWTKRKPYAKQTRSIVYCAPGWWNSEFDFEGVQVRIVAVESQDPILLQAFLPGGNPDLHSATGRFLFCPEISLEDFIKQKKSLPYSKFRDRGKTTMFALLFGAHSGIMYNDVDSWGEPEQIAYEQKYGPLPHLRGTSYEKKNNYDQRIYRICEHLQKRFFELYAGVKDWFKRQEEKGMRDGYIDSIVFGRRHLPQLKYIGKDDDMSSTGNLKRILMNTVAQNPEAHLIYRAAPVFRREFKARGLKGVPFNVIHDSYQIRHPKEELEEIIYVQKMAMDVHESVYGIPFTTAGDSGVVPGFGVEHSKDTIPRLMKGSIYRAEWTDEGKNKVVEDAGYDQDDFCNRLKIPEYAKTELVHT